MSKEKIDLNRFYNQITLIERRKKTLLEAIDNASSQEDFNETRLIIKENRPIASELWKVYRSIREEYGEIPDLTTDLENLKTYAREKGLFCGEGNFYLD